MQGSETRTSYQVAIIGAGPTGLACAIEAQNLALSHIVFEKGCLTNSIFNFPAQMVFFTTPELLEIGGLPLVTEREKPTRNEALKYYRRVVASFKLNVHQYEAVESTRSEPDHHFRIQTSRALYEADNLVIATGYYDNPNMIGIPGEELPHDRPSRCR